MKSKRKASGGIRRTKRRSNKKLAWKGGIFTATRIEEKEKEERVVLNKRGNTQKVKQKIALNASVFVPEKKKTIKCKLLTALFNPANEQFPRRNIITKGTIVEIDLDGKKHLARITSRPGQV